MHCHLKRIAQTVIIFTVWSKLEEQYDDAVKEGNFSKAEKLSDEISQQELGLKIADAIERRDYKKQKEVEEKWKKSKKKKKLLWGFEQKEKWESKGNMCSQVSS